MEIKAINLLFGRRKHTSLLIVFSLSNFNTSRSLINVITFIYTYNYIFTYNHLNTPLIEYAHNAIGTTKKVSTYDHRKSIIFK